MNGIREILETLRSSGFRDLNGSRAATTLSVAEPLLNAIVSASLPRDSPVRAVSVHPNDGDRLAIRAKLARPAFLPPINITVVIERQPELPDNPILNLRITGFAGLLALAGPVASLASKLPRGVRLDADLVSVDLRALLAGQGYEDLLQLVRRIGVHSREGRVLIEIEAAA